MKPHHPTSRRAAWLLLAVTLIAVAGCPFAPAPPADPSARVVILAQRGLSGPLAGLSPARAPAQVLDPDDLPDGIGELAVFELDIATARPGALRLRLVARDAAGELIRAESADAGSLAADLAAAPGVFHVAQPPATATVTATATPTPTVTVTVTIPTAALDPASRLEVFTRTADDGTPLDADGFPLVRGFFHMAVLGDSVSWGNGLPDADKYPALVARAIEESTQLRVVRQTLAHSGAMIVPRDFDILCTANCSGEVPTFTTSVSAQVALIDRPELLDLVLVGGCITDVSVRDLFFTNLSEAAIIERTDLYCGEVMAALLRQVRAAAPQAPIVVTGYYPVVSTLSDPLGLGEWLAARSQTTIEDLSAIVEKLAGQSAVFLERSDLAIASAVATVAAESPADPGIAFAPVPFGPENASFAPEAWLWGSTDRHPLAEWLGLDLQIFPEDPLADFRFGECNRPGVIPGLIECIYASVAHPNREGAVVYRDAIVEALRTLAVLPASE